MTELDSIGDDAEAFKDAMTPKKKAKKQQSKKQKEKAQREARMDKIEAEKKPEPEPPKPEALFSPDDLEWMQERAVTIWKGQSPDLPIVTRVARIRASLKEKGFKQDLLDQIQLPLPRDKYERFL